MILSHQSICIMHIVQPLLQYFKSVFYVIQYLPCMQVAHRVLQSLPMIFLIYRQSSIFFSFFFFVAFFTFENQEDFVKKIRMIFQFLHSFLKNECTISSRKLHARLNILI